MFLEHYLKKINIEISQQTTKTLTITQNAKSLNIKSFTCDLFRSMFIVSIFMKKKHQNEKGYNYKECVSYQNSTSRNQVCFFLKKNKIVSVLSIT